MESRDSGVILIVDGDDGTREQLCESLQATSLRIEESRTVTEALSRVEAERARLVLAEIRLPDASGFSLCRRLREDHTSQDVSVILISDWASEMDRILAFESGADDFLARPFYDRELTSRISALLRRQQDRRASTEANGPAPLEAPAPSVNRRPSEARLRGRRLDLTRKESAILATLASGGGSVMSRRQLIDQVWGESAGPTDRCIDSHVKSLRKKLGPAATSVETVRGIGYRFAPHPDLELR